MLEFVAEMDENDWLTDPEKLFNVDETSFCVNPKLGKVVAKRGARNVYSMTPENEKDCYTALLGGNNLFIYIITSKMIRAVISLYI